MASQTNHRPSLTRGAGEGRLRGWVVEEGAKEDPASGRVRRRGGPGLAGDAACSWGNAPWFPFW